MSDVNRIIARHIIYAQMASDAGKGIVSLKTSCHSFDDEVKNKGYDTKDGFIFKAVSLIRGTKTNFNYWVEKAPDQRGNMSFGVYFDFKVDGKRQQVSFHTFSKKWVSLVHTGRKTRWDKDPIGSRRSCEILIDYYGL